MESPIASGIISLMQRRETNLLDNDILLGSIYVDPKHRFLLNDEQIKKAKEALYDLSIKLKLFLEKSLVNPSQSAEADIATEFLSSSSNDESDFDKYLDNIEKAKIKQIKTTEQGLVDSKLIKYKEDFNAALKEIEKYERSCKIPLLELIKIYPDIIKEVALLVTALPPTQVSVERLFSTLKFIKSDLRASIKEDLAEAILFLRNC